MPIVIRKDQAVIYKETLSSRDTMEVAGKALALAKEYHVKPQNIFIDAIGIGAGVVDRLREQGWPVNGITVGSKSFDSKYYNLRAELLGKVKDWLALGSLTHSDDWYELANIRYKFNSNGSLQLEKKEDMKSRGLASPDVADALALTFAYTPIQPQPQASPSYVPDYMRDIGLFSGTVEPQRGQVIIRSNSNRFASQELGWKEPIKASEVVDPYPL